MAAQLLAALPSLAQAAGGSGGGAEAPSGPINSSTGPVSQSSSVSSGWTFNAGAPDRFPWKQVALGLAALAALVAAGVILGKLKG